MKKKFSVVLALAMVFVMMMGSGVMAAPAVWEQISNILEAEITVEEEVEPIDPQDWIKLSWGDGTEGEIEENKLTVTVKENEAKTAVVKAEKHKDIGNIERVLYIMEVKDKDGQAIDKDVLEAVASGEQEIGYDDEGKFWYWGPRDGFTFLGEEHSTQFTYTFSEAGTYYIEIYAVQLGAAVVKNADELAEALENEEITKITISGTIGDKGNYTIYTLERNGVTIKGLGNAKVFGTFVIKGDNVTIDGLAIENKGDLNGQSSPNRGAIYVYANSVTITNNTITNGLGENEGLSNGIQIMSPTKNNPLSNYVIENNTIIGHENKLREWSSSGIVIVQGFRSGTVGGYAETITAEKNDYTSILENNIFENNKINLTHQDWRNEGDNVVLFIDPEPETETD